MKKFNLTLLLIVCLAVLGHAQAYQKTDLGIKSIVDSTAIEIQVYSPTTIRIVKSLKEVPFTKESLSVIKEPQKTAFSVKQDGDLIIVKTAKIDVSLNKQNGKVSFFSKKAGNLLSEESSAVFTDFNDVGNKTYSVSQTFKLNQDEDIYGLGQHQHGKMSQRNTKFNMVQSNKDDYVPFFVSTKGYGLFWDNYSPTLFEDTPEATLFKSEVGDCVDYYFMFGESMDGSIACMRDLTGQAPMFPLWTYGFWQSKERYKSQNEVVGVVKKYRELGVPLDGIIQDWQYWDSNYLWNAMEFLSPQYRDPKRMIENIHNMNAHIIVSIWSSFGSKTKQFQEMEPKGMLLDFGTWPLSGIDVWPPRRDYLSGAKAYDPFNPEARDIYWKYLNKGLFSLGIDGWWMDSTEPDHMNPKPTDFDNKTYLGSLRKVRNAYPLMTVGGVYENQRKASSDKRVFILTRSAFAGQQRYGANTWTGDINSTWDALRRQIPAGLNFTLSAIPHWNSDIGGFFANAYNNTDGDGTATKNPSYQELYVRWMQFGAFCPMMRSHGTQISREIYHFGEKGEPVYDAIVKAIELRYSLLPYIYSTSWEVTNKQGSFMRALAMDFDDKKVRNMNNEYMFGTSILVAPIVNAQYTSEKAVKSNEYSGWEKTNSEDDRKTLPAVDFTQPKSTKVYLPAGTAWFNFWTGEKIDGGQEITTETKIDMIPLYVKQGSIIPFGPQVQFATEKNWESLLIRVYPGANGEFTLYEDENDNYNYEKGAYSTITFKWNDKSKTLTISDRKGSFSGMLNNRKFKVELAGKDSTYKDVEYKGKATSVKLNSQTR
ncbi:DUF5110 domain-containing protein [Dysgonomonas sp. 216]|uniref:glycoside hydrolase family 31 protein n=1 Tax=Dysgonomonas sp. 216 TaxID=2302934 RepID=UPI0013D2D1E9|nr:TIM-barrel domain-containing protein [Dysgonomonas sp. 216]NDW17638.1 DUF5110 domain-containing protein [Dysgonomonas sp. 216]